VFDAAGSIFFYIQEVVMNIKEFAFSSVCAGVGTVLSTWLGGWDIALNILVMLMVIDYLTGVLCAVKRKQVNSEVMFWGGIRKVVILAVIALAVLFDQLLGNPDPVFRTLAIYFYVAREGVSVTENLGLIGVPLPPAIANALEQLQKKGDGQQ
jgi:toxin secretion/phage lysis holin